MAIPLFAAIIAGAGGGGPRKETITVTVAQLLSGKVVEGFGYSDGTDIPSGGSRSPTTVDGKTVKGIYHDTLLATDLFEISVNGTGGAKGDIIFVDVETDAGTVRLTPDSNTTFNDSGSRMLWTWNSTDHSIPDWVSDLGNSVDVDIYHTGIG